MHYDLHSNSPAIPAGWPIQRESLMHSRTKKALLPIFLLLSFSASGATFIVNETSDLADANPGDGICEASAGSGNCSIRAAVMEANVAAGPHLIELPAGDFVLSISGVGNNNASAGDLDILTSITIRGAGSDATRIDGNDSIRVLHVQSGFLNLEDVTIQNGRADNATEFTGGGIQAEANLSLRRVHMVGNRANAGAALRAVATNVEILDSTFTGNEALDAGMTNVQGNAVYGGDSAVIVLRSTFFGNALPIASGASANNIVVVGGSLDMVNSTVADNDGTAVRAQNADLFISHSTITGNHGAQLSTFSFSGTDTMEVVGSILQSTPFGFVNCANQNHVSLGYNISEDSSCGFTATGDLQNTDALLGPLKANAGPTQTRLPMDGSPAINLVPASSCLDEDGDPLAQDQRGLPRPAPDNANCDAGSVETGNHVVFRDRFEA